MDERLIRTMREAGASEGCIRDLAARLNERRRAIPLGAVTCPACGSRALRNDYACGACGSVKARRERRFWGWVFERDQGGEGRPKPEKPLPQRLPSVELPSDSRQFRWVSIDEPSCRILSEWLVTSGGAGVVVVAEWAFEAVRWAKILLGLGETAGATWISLGLTWAPATSSREREHELRPVFEEVAR